MITFEEFSHKYETELKENVEEVCAARGRIIKQEVLILILSILVFILLVNLVDFSARKYWLDSLLEKEFFNSIFGMYIGIVLKLTMLFCFDLMIASLILGYIVYSLLVITKIIKHVIDEEYYDELEKNLVKKIMKEFYIEVGEVSTIEKDKIKELKNVFGLSWDRNIYLHGKMREYSILIEKEIEYLIGSSFITVKLNNALPFEARIGYKGLIAGTNLVQVKGENIREIIVKWFEALKCNIRYDYTTQEGRAFLQNYIFGIIENERELRKMYRISFLTDKLIITRTAWIFSKSLKKRLSVKNIYNDIKCLNDALIAYEEYISSNQI